MKKKLLITALLVMALMLSLCLVASATEYVVTNSDEFNSAYDSASDGDTIVISGDITASLKFGKSITYVLRANWQPSSWGEFSGGNTEISIIADGGDFKLQPTNYSGNGMLQQYSDTAGKYVLNLGGINGGTLTFDGANVTNPRLMYVGGKLDLSWNLLNGARISGFNLTTTHSDVKARIIHATEFNMYEGSKICGNSIPANSAALINTTALNIYGGEICHNYSQGNRNWSTDCGFIYVNGNVNMYGGKIYENVINASMNKNFYGFIDITSGNTVAIFGGYIGENYASTSGNISSIFGVASENVTYCYFKNQEYGKTLKYSGGSVSLVDGKWVVSDAATTEEQLTDPSFNWKGYKGSSDSVIAFFESDSLVIGDVSLSRYKAIEGYIQGVNLKDAWNNNQGTNKTYSLTGSDYGVPTISELWSTKENDCKNAIVLDSSTVNGSYFAVAHKYAEDDFNCETGDTCLVCGLVLEGNTHTVVEKLEYKNGFLASGVYTYECTNEGCTACDVTKEIGPIFVCLGYTKTEVGTVAIMQGFVVNKEALSLYNSVNGNDIVGYGLVAGTVANLGTDTDVFENGAVKENVKAITRGFEAFNYDIMEIKITGFEGETGNEYVSSELYCCGYYITEDNASTYITADENKAVYETDTLVYSISCEKIQ